MIAFIFPGQGSQVVGMGKAFYDTFSEARFIFQEVDDILHENLSHIMFEGPLEVLTRTEYAQPALMAVGLAALKVLEVQGGFNVHSRVHIAAGHSLGEYTALAAAKSLTVGECAFLLKTRGKAMSDALPEGVGGMAAILGMEIQAVEELTSRAAEHQTCVVANDNMMGQVIISGHDAAIERAIGLAQHQGAKRCIRLNVSSAFHSPLMESAIQKMEEALEKVHLKKPVIPLIPNVTVKLETDSLALKQNLIHQITRRVRWRETMERMAENGITTSLEIGPGGVLSGLMRKGIPGIKTYGLHTPDDMELFLKDVA